MANIINTIGVIAHDESIGIDDDANDRRSSDVQLQEAYQLSGLTADSVLGAAFVDNYLTFNTPTTSLSFIDAEGNLFNGTEATDSTGEPVTAYIDGEWKQVYYVTDPDNPNVLFGVTDYGTDTQETAFSVVLLIDEDGNADAVILQSLPLQHSDTTDADDAFSLNGVHVGASGETVFDNFSDAPPGKNEWLTFGDNDDVQLLATGGEFDLDSGTRPDGYSVNTSTIGIGADNQSVNPGETLRIDTITGQGDADNKDPGTLDYTDHVDLTAFSWTAVQTGGNAATRVDAEVSIFSVEDPQSGGTSNSFYQSLNGTGETAIDIMRVEVYRPDSDTPIEVWEGGAIIVDGDAELTISVDGSSATVTGMLVDYSVKVYSAPGDSFNRIEISNVDANSNDTFDVGVIRVTEAIADQRELVDSISFQDSGPTVALAVNSEAQIASVDEGELPATATADGDAIFDSIIDGGTDGLQSTEYSLQLASEGADSGLVYTATGESVQLFTDNGSIVGRTASGEEVIRIDIDSDTGSLTFTQLGSVVHPAGNTPDGTLNLSSEAGVQVVLSATDNDGDSAVSQAVDISSLFAINDDGPTVMLSLSAEAAPLNVSEGSLPASDSAAGASLFNTMIDAGNDGIGAVSYSLQLNAEGADSGLVLTATGEPVQLFVEDGAIVGRTPSSDEDVIRIEIDAESGDLTFTQLQAVIHPDGSDPGDVLTLSSTAGIEAVLAVSDGDGTQSSAVIDISDQFSITDDGPSAALSLAADAATVTVDESGLPATTAVSLESVFDSNVDGGADGLASVSYALDLEVEGADSGLVLSNTGESVSLYTENGAVVGRTNEGNEVIRIVLDSESGNLSFTQFEAVSHPDGSDPADVLGLSSSAGVLAVMTVVDNDGDTAQSESLDISGLFAISDDGPSATLTLNREAATLNVDESGLPASTSANGSSLFVADIDSGNDGLSTLTYSLQLGSEGADSGLILTATGESVQLFVDNGAIVGRTPSGEQDVLRIEMDAQTGNLTFTQLQAVVHPDETDVNDVLTLSNEAGIQAVLTVTDGDGDTASSQAVDISNQFAITDDGPSATLSLAEEATMLNVDESGLPATATASVDSVFDSQVDGGADGLASVSYTLNLASEGADSGLLMSTTGESIKLYSENGAIVGRTDSGNEVIRIELDSETNNLSFTQINAVAHPDGSDPNDILGLSANAGVQATLLVTDNDGDSVASESVDITGLFSINDDGPSATLTLAENVQPLNVDESSLPATSTASVISLFDGLVEGGADGLAAFSYSLSLENEGADSGLVMSTTNQSVNLYTDNGAVVGRTENGIEVIRIEFDVESGDLTFTQLEAVIHPDGSDPDDVMGLSGDAGILAVLTDFDNDGDSAQANAIDISSLFTINDDGPTLDSAQDLEVSNLPGASATGQLGFDAGADSSGGIAITDATGTQGATGEGLEWQHADVDNDGIVGQNEIVGTLDGEDLYTLKVEDSGQYDFTMTGEIPNTELTLDTSNIKAGGPDSNFIIVGAIDSSNPDESYLVKISGFSDGEPDAVNESNLNVGVANGNLDSGETLQFELFRDTNGDGLADDAEQISLTELSIGTKTAQGFDYSYSLDGAAQNSGTAGKDERIELSGSELFSSVELNNLNGDAVKIGLEDIFISIPGEDLNLAFDVQGSDLDGDTAGYTDGDKDNDDDPDSFSVHISNGDDGF